MKTEDVNEVVIDVWGEGTAATVVVWSWVKGGTVTETGEVDEVVIDVWGDESVTTIVTAWEEVWITGVLEDARDETWVSITAELWAREEMGRLFIEADTGTEVSIDSTKLLNGDELATTVELSAPSKTKRTIKG